MEAAKGVARGGEEAHRRSSRSFESTNATIKDPFPPRCRCCYRCFCNAAPLLPPLEPQPPAPLSTPPIHPFCQRASVSPLVSYTRMPKDNLGTRFPIPNTAIKDSLALDPEALANFQREVFLADSGARFAGLAFRRVAILLPNALSVTMTSRGLAISSSPLSFGGNRRSLLSVFRWVELRDRELQCLVVE